MKKLAVFYHSLTHLGEPPSLLPAAPSIITEQMQALKESGLEESATEIHCGINGGTESQELAYTLLPEKSYPHMEFHGLKCRNENLTLVMLEKWLKDHPDWYVLYFHSKGATKPAGDEISTRWRGCMMKHCVRNWRQCVEDLDAGFEAVGCHWMEPPATPPTQYIFAGTFFWATSDFLRTLPSIYERDRIKESGIEAFESRYECEVWIGNGPRPPKIKDYHGPFWTPGQVHTCQP